MLCLHVSLSTNNLNNVEVTAKQSGIKAILINNYIASLVVGLIYKLLSSTLSAYWHSEL